jgi:hypothetical protein
MFLAMTDPSLVINIFHKSKVSQIQKIVTMEVGYGRR